jgi:Protein of unknown function (DUF3570)
MWMQLTGALAFAAAVLVASTGAAEPLARVDSRSSVYEDSDRTNIVTSNVAARGAPSDHVGVEARYLVDVITSASVDVITAATGAFHETRHEAQGGASYHDDYRRLSASYVYSTEHDWQSHTGNASFQQDIVRHDLTLKIAGTFVANEVGRAGDPTFRRRLFVGGGTTGLTFVLGPADLLDLGYTLSYLEGYQASPYRFVSFGEGNGPLLLSGPETDPDRRVRHAVTSRWNHHLFGDTALRSHVRGYVDDWGVASVTAGTEYVVGFGPIETGVFVRGYAQRHARFYAPEYASPMRYMTADRELASFVDGFGGARLAWRRARMGVFEDVHLEAKGTGFAFRFYDFPRLRERTGAIGEIAFGVAF